MSGRWSFRETGETWSARCVICGRITTLSADLGYCPKKCEVEWERRQSEARKRAKTKAKKAQSELFDGTR